MYSSRISGQRFPRYRRRQLIHRKKSPPAQRPNTTPDENTKLIWATHLQWQADQDEQQVGGGERGEEDICWTLSDLEHQEDYHPVPPQSPSNPQHQGDAMGKILKISVFFVSFTLEFFFSLY